MNESRIQAVDHVHLQAGLGLEQELTWFYGEVALLEPLPPDPLFPGRIRFRSHRLELRISLCERPLVEAVACRLTVRVPSLEDTASVLDERSMAFERLTGTMWTDRRLEVLDPGGNRVAFKQEWPFAPL